MTSMDSAEPNLPEQVLDRIRESKVRIRSRLSLVAEQLGLDGIGLVMLLVGAVAVNLVLFWLRANEAVSWFALGPLGMRAFFEAFPYLWLASATLAFVAIGSILHRLSVRAKPVPSWFLLAIVGFGIGLGSTAAFSTVNERLLEAEAPVSPVLRRVYTFTSHHGRSGVVGQIMSVSDDTVELDVQGQRVLVELPTQSGTIKLPTVQLGDRVLVVSPSATERPVRAINVKKLRSLHRPVQVNVRFIYPHPAPRG